MDSTFRAQLKSLKTQHVGLTPDHFWVAQTKEKLLKQISGEKKINTVLESKLLAGWQIFFPARFTAFARPAFAVMLIVFTSVAGWGATVSASYSIPGDKLYGVKLATEKTQIAMANLVGAKEKKAQLLGQSAKNRAYETKALIEQNKMDKVDESLVSLKDSINQAQESLKDVSNNQPDSTKEVATQMTITTVEVVNTLNQVLVNLPSVNSATSTETVQLVGKIVNAQQEVSNKNIEAVGLVVEKQQKGEINLTNDETQKLVIEAISQTTDAMSPAVSTDKLENTSAGAVLTSVQNIIITTNTMSMASTSTIDNLSEAMGGCKTNCAVNNAAGSVSGSTVVQKVNDAIKVEVDTAKQMAQGGQLLEALQVAKQVSEVSGEIKQAVVMAAQTSETVPVVGGVEKVSASSTVEVKK